MLIGKYWRITCVLLMAVFLCGGFGCDHDSSNRRDQIIYVAMGASDAAGIGAFPPTQGYVYRIRDKLGAYADKVILYNLGISGKRIAYIEETELPEAIACKPDVISIWAGPNDLTHGNDVREFEISLQNVFRQLREKTSAIVVMANIPDMTALPRFLVDPDADVTVTRIRLYNEAIARQCAAYRIPMIDLYAGGYATDWEYVSIDGFHPSNQGHAKLANLYFEIIADYL